MLEVVELLRIAGVKVPISTSRVPYAVTMAEVEKELTKSNGAIVKVFREDGRSHFVVVEKILSPAEATKLGLPVNQGTLVVVTDSNEASRFYATLDELLLRMRYRTAKTGYLIPLP